MLLAPRGGSADPAVVVILTLGYFSYSVGVVALTWTRHVTTAAMPLVTHAVDMVIFSVFILLTEGVDSPFYVCLVFITICGAIRWYAYGAIVTGATALASYMIVTIGVQTLPAADDLRTAEFISRCAQLAVVSGLLAYLGAHQQRLQEEIASLAAWPRRLPTRESDALEEVLSYVARVLNAPRVVLAWEEGDEPNLRLAFRDGERFELKQVRPDAFGTLVHASLQRSSFVCTGIGQPNRRVLQRVPGGFALWKGEPLDTRFRERFNITNVVALKLSSESIEGWLFTLDRARASPDDILLGDIVGRLVAGSLELQTLLEQLRETAAGEERIRIARELHDGVLQSLTAASLQAQRARQAVMSSPAEVERRLATIEETILSEQQALRLAIDDLKPGAIKPDTPVDVAPRIREVASRLARQWEVRAHLNLQRDIPLLPRRTAHEVSRMIHEAIVNAIRHGGAKEVTITCIALGAELAMSVSYHGRGFAGFHGRHGLDSLNQMQVGPRTLKERVAAIGGDLEIESGENGARVEIRVPLTPAAAPSH